MELYNRANVGPISDNICRIFDPNIVSLSACNGNLEKADIVSNIVPILVLNICPILVSNSVKILEANVRPIFENE